MKVGFHAYPGINYATPGKSDIVTGDGTYEEAWVAPDRWRREICLGGYHAVEVRADGRRTFQASSDYEPSRAVMLLDALLAPLPRTLLEPELDERKIHWKTEHLTTGTIPWVRISFRDDGGHGVPAVRAYSFLSSGILVRREEEYSGLLTSWDDNRVFAGKIVPRHLSVRGAGLDGDMVTATITVEPLSLADRAVEQIPGEQAEPGKTLRPIEDMDNEGASPVHFEPPPPNTGNYPQDVKTSVIAVVDREGIPREVEVSAVRIYGQKPTPEALGVVAATAENMVKASRKNRFHPGLIDGKPCQTYWSLNFYSGSTSSM
jgi:hypothetical protein